MTNDLKTFLDNLSSDWDPIKIQTTKYFDRDSKIREDGAAQIFRRPWVASQNFGLLLFPPIVNDWLDIYKKNNARLIPKSYSDILLQMNGCFVYDFSLFGLPQSLYTTALLDRSKLQQFDIGTANRSWINEYEISEDYLYIGSRAYSSSENIGYFIDSNTNILSIRKNGQVLNNWTTFKDFLFEEIISAENIMLADKRV